MANETKQYLYFKIFDIEEVLRKNAPNIEKGMVSSCHCRCELKVDMEMLPLYLQEILVASTKDTLEQTIGIPKSKIYRITKEEFEQAQENMEQRIIEFPKEDGEEQCP